MTIRLEPTGSNTVHKAGRLHFPSGTRRRLVLPHEDWDTLERLVDYFDTLVDAAGRIRELHTDSVAGVCPCCYRLNDVSDTDDGLVDWPCPTLQAIGFRP